MRHHVYGDDPAQASVAILVKERSFDTVKIKRHYIDPLGAQPEAFLAYSLWYNEKNKCPAELAKDHLQNVLLSVKKFGIKTILITDAAYFKFLTNAQKPAQNFLGYVNSSQIDGYDGEFTVFYVPNYQAGKHNPRTAEDMEYGLKAFQAYLKGCYVAPGQSVIHTAEYPQTPKAIKAALARLLAMPELTVDVETKGLKFYNCGIATISFAWDQHNFISFPVDRITDCGYSKITATVIKKLLRTFFEQYTGKLIPHNAGFDFKVLVFELWMKDLQDYEGMIAGIQFLTRDFDDTKIITYLATNNAIENVLKLKVLASEYLGDWGVDVEDTTLIDLPDLLEYNGKDALGTWYIHNKYRPKMLADQQEKIYEEEFKPSVITLLQTELVGLPIFPDKVAHAKKTLEATKAKYTAHIQKSQVVKEFQLQVKAEKCIEFTEAAKKKIFTMDDPRITRLEFNPNSNQQVGHLLNDYMGLPVLETTDTGLPATGGKVLQKLIHHTTNPEYKKIIKALIELTRVEKILTSFIPAFEAAVQMPDGTWRLYGNFNLGGTKSGRLSSSDPNLTNIPSGSFYGKLIKECFGALGQWLFCGADFNSLEDMVSALTTRDPNKLKVYIDGFDGHSLRAFYYFPDQLPGIIDSVKSINSIKKLFPKVRQASKEPTFLLTYGGTYHGLMSNLGLGLERALEIEENYHTLYQVSDEWVQERLQQAALDGYVTGAFGLRLRTPLLAAHGPGEFGYIEAAEGRTAGNMLGQSYGMLNSRAANEFRERVWASKYKCDILPCGQIHDALYYLIRNKAGIAKWVNDNLIDCMRWVGLVELQHPTVKIGAELDIFFPSWAQATTLKNGISTKAILTLCKPPEKT